MTLRREPTYLSVEVWRALLLIAKHQNGDVEMQRAKAADEIADDLLREVIRQRWPALFEHQKTVAKMEAELIKTL